MVEESQDAEGRIPFRLRIGVTGHRDLLDPDGVARLVQKQIEALRDRFPATATTSVAFTIYSSLAEGADQVVARQALQVLGDRAELHAVLPRGADDYRTDFDTSAVLSGFEDLLARATSVHELPATLDRDEGYEAAGRYVVEKADVLIAVWDGRRPGQRGGTAETVLYARRLGVAVAVVPARRASSNSVEPEIDPAERDYDLAEPADAYDRLREFNRDSVRSGDLRRCCQQTEQRLRALAEDSSIQWEYESVAAWALPRMVRADRLALRYQNWHYRLGASLFLLAALAVTAVAAQLELRLNDKFALVEVGLMLLAVGIYLVSRRLAAHERWLGFRSLAEAFRSGLFIALVGSDAGPTRAPREPDESSEPWFQRAFSESWPQRPHLTERRTGRSEISELRTFLVEAWVDDQVNYHRSAVARLRRSRNRLSRIVLLLFGIAIVVGLLHAFHPAPLDGSGWRRLFVFLAIALPGFGAALTGIRDQRQFRIHEERSQRAAVRLDRLKRDLESQNTLRSLQKLALQVQAVIEAETVEWSGVVEFQDLEIVI